MLLLVFLPLSFDFSIKRLTISFKSFETYRCLVHKFKIFLAIINFCNFEGNFFKIIGEGLGITDTLVC